MSKDKYKVCNWRQYNAGLKQRGAITIWISEDVLAAWRYQGERKRGGKRVYSDLAIEICLTVRKVYHLGYRQTEGFVESFFQHAKVGLPVPDYTVICRRSQGLPLRLEANKGKPITAIVADSTGLKVYGEGEWKVRKHGWSKHRRWMKLHIALDAEGQSVEAVELTTNSVDDAEVVGQWLPCIEAVVGSFTADGGYDQLKVWQALEQKALAQAEAIRVCIPLRPNAVMDKQGRSYLVQRNDAIKAIRRLGKPQWKVLSNYHQRSKAETFMFRYKIILGATLQARSFSRQQTEVKVGCKILNQMLRLAKPHSEKVA